MAKTKKIKKTIRKKFLGVMDPTMKSYENEPFFIKKAEEAKAFLKKVGLPKEVTRSK